MIITIPLNKLQLSDRNVRKTNREEGIEALADDIVTSGLKQNLVVTESTGKKGHYEVDAGGRRFLAMKLAASQKRLPPNFPVPCLVEPREQALETSLSENLHRVAMNPADEFDAFAAIIATYAECGIANREEQIANCARRFGVTVRHVEQRLRLAALEPTILEALRQGEISLDSAKAYAAYPDQKLQLEIYRAQCKQSWNAHSVHAIRSAFAGKIYRKGDRQVRYVGLDRYLQAGGRVELELFMGSEDEEVLLDTALLDDLCRQKAEPEAQRLAQELGFLDGLVQPWGPNSAYAKPKVPKGYDSYWRSVERLTPEERAEAILVCAIADDGSELQATEMCFQKAVERQGTTGTYSPESETERLARIRRQEVELKAARLAAPRVTGTALEGRAFWPVGYWVRPIEQEEDGTFTVAMLIKVPAADVEAAMAEAERLYDEEEAKRAAASENNSTEAGDSENNSSSPAESENNSAELEGASA